MGREVRMVHKDWVHPEGKSLYEGFGDALKEWKEARAKWDEGFRRRWVQDGAKWVKLTQDDIKDGFVEWIDEEPTADDYMPDWTEEEKTHLMMYETCSEGSAISPSFETPEDLARWLADNSASAFGNMTASYEQWLATCKAGSVCSAIISNGKLDSGVADSAR